ncbi:tol-pal system protein YbgF [Roseibacterium sp. SDUM158017]|uniref:tol-pal system protein YbgF n=1 Tax=Roseicyclus salinarum TaxID=3036773 RepID=UPI00241561A6|nr:tol-pal system protein YbgF [Roseibacterium sp. SDUM158017]MDG4648224.1 tol-pal system protein YbgF [Roseibacterium sp. SDUM158017]
MRRLASLALCAALVLPGAASAQDRTQTLADIRQELSVLFVELQRLGRELNTTGGAGGSGASGSALQRMDAIEAELRRLTALTEELQIRIDRVVRDGTTRVGDLEFRLCELESDCDIATLGETSNLGGVEPSGAAPVLPQGPVAGDGAPQLAVAEQDDFDRAREAFEAGDYASAASLLEAFTQTYPGGPLSAEAHYLRGEAEGQQGSWSRAARAYLDSFSAAPDGERAPWALTKLGLSLGRLGQLEEACVTLDEVGLRYPGSPAVQEAEAGRFNLGCS